MVRSLEAVYLLHQSFVLMKTRALIGERARRLCKISPKGMSLNLLILASTGNESNLNLLYLDCRTFNLYVSPPSLPSTHPTDLSFQAKTSTKSCPASTVASWKKKPPNGDKSTKPSSSSSISSSMVPSESSMMLAHIFLL